jgi:elongation factor Ts
MEINAKQVNDLRQKTGAGMMDCKKALVETQGDLEKAVDYLRMKGLSAASKKAGRETSEGRIGSYIHSNGKLGVLVEVNCETDFVAKTDLFQNFVKDIAMHIAASAPVCVREEDMPADFVEKERAIIQGQVKEDPKMTGKPQDMIDKIVEGKLKKIYQEQVLLNQKFVKNPDITVGDYLKTTIAALGENMGIRKFSRLMLGEGA